MRLGRNDACPCGSGKKYKKCCLTTSGATRHGDLDALVRAIPEEVIEAAMAAADKWSPEDYARVSHELLTKHPIILNLVACALQNATQEFKNRAYFSLVVMIAMFERHYGPNSAPIGVEDLAEVLRRNAALLKKTIRGIPRLNPGDVVQPFVLMFLMDTVYDYVKGEVPEQDLPALTAGFKTAVDLLDRAYANQGQVPSNPSPSFEPELIGNRLSL